MYDWMRLAPPQADGYDTEVCLAEAGLRGYRRPTLEQSVRRILDDQVAVVSHVGWSAEEFIPASPEHENIRQACDLLLSWPAGYRQCSKLLDTVYVALAISLPEGTWGSTCGAGPGGFGKIAVTANHAGGMAEALVHEMAHHKLRAFGIELERAERLFVNDPKSRYPSPVRYDCLRPMSAVFHGQYSFTYVLALDVCVAKTSKDRGFAVDVAKAIGRYVPKLQFGSEVIREHAEADDAGSEFLRGYRTWFDEVLGEAQTILHDLGVPETPFAHPLL